MIQAGLRAQVRLLSGLGDLLVTDAPCRAKHEPEGFALPALSY